MCVLAACSRDRGCAQHNCCLHTHNLHAGGTESILLAVKASRDYMVGQRGISGTPEMVVGPSAHAAYWKAAEYFKIKLVIAPLGKDLRWAWWLEVGFWALPYSILLVNSRHQRGAAQPGHGQQSLLVACYQWAVS